MGVLDENRANTNGIRHNREAEAAANDNPKSSTDDTVGLHNTWKTH